MNDSLTLQVRNVVEAIRPANEAAEEWLERKGIPSETRFLVTLVLEELVTNCIKHGYDDSDEHSIDVVLSVAHHVLTMLFIDDGHAFDASEAAAPDLSLEIEHRPIGGLGIHLVRELTDSMSYERRDGKNRLTLTIRFG
jgi:serine/threonine-protein kinase RsbW